jgi:hypothetical protein
MSAAVPKANRLSSSNASVEAALYPLVKAFLEWQGYVVRSEVRGCDLVARRGDEAPVIVELKLRFTLPLLLQGIDRLALSPLVYLAVPRPMARTRGVRPDAKPVRKLCRRLGLGLIPVFENAGPDQLLLDLGRIGASALAAEEVRGRLDYCVHPLVTPCERRRSVDRLLLRGGLTSRSLLSKRRRYRNRGFATFEEPTYQLVLLERGVLLQLVP